MINRDVQLHLSNPNVRKVNYEDLNVIQYKYELLSNGNQHSNFIEVITRDIKQEKITDKKLLNYIKED